MKRLLFCLATCAVSTLGCGHPASEQECEEILERSAEVELRQRNVTDPAVIKERIAAAREAKRDELMKHCVGRRITDGAMKCIRGAKDATELENCLR